MGKNELRVRKQTNGITAICGLPPELEKLFTLILLIHRPAS